MKTISAFSRRPDLSREAFRDYYETRHAPLGMAHFPFTKYVRNHVVDSAGQASGIDCISEFYVDDWARSAELTRAETGELFARDEQQFMDRNRIAAAVVEETVIQGPPRGVDRDGTRRRILCIDLPAGDTRQKALQGLEAWAARLPAAGRRVTLDVVVGLAGDSFPYNARFPYDALVSVWTPAENMAPLPILPAGAVMLADLLVDVCESSPQDLAAHLIKARDAASPAAPSRR